MAAAEIVRYVDPDATPNGNDGTTWSKAYLSLYDAIEAEWAAGANLTTRGGGDGSWLHIYCRSSAGTADTHTVTVDGFTTSATCYIKVEAASTDRASASGYSVSKYRLETTDVAFLTIMDNHVWIDGLQAKKTATSASVYGIGTTTVAAGSWLYISNCYLVVAGGYTGNNVLLGINDADHTVTVWNTILLCVATAGTRRATSSTGLLIFYNCVIYGFTNSGLRGADGVNNVAKNCAVFATGDDFNYFTTISHCASDDGDTTDGTDISESGGGAAWPNDFEDAAVGDFRLKSGSGLVGTGVADPGSGLFSDDIEKTARGAAWDVGAFEYPAAPPDYDFTERHHVRLVF